MGTPAFAVPSLEAAAAKHDVALVVTQPDRPAGRGKKLTPPPVKETALALGLDVYQPEKIRDDAAWDRLVALAPDVIVVVGYGQFIPKRILDLPPHGCVNVHSSLLPKYRGAAPANWAIARGETVSGVSTMRLVPKMDAGDVLLQREVEIGPEETAAELNERLAPLGAGLLLETLASLEAGTITPQVQDEDAVTFAPLMKREDGLIDWTASAREIHNRMRGFDPWPGAYTARDGRRLHLRKARISDRGGDPGRVAIDGGRLWIGTGDGSLEALEVQPEGKKRMSVSDFVRGYRPQPGEVWG